MKELELILLIISIGSIILGGGLVPAVKKWLKDWGDAWENGVITREEFYRQLDDTFNIIGIIKHLFKRK